MFFRFFSRFNCKLKIYFVFPFSQIGYKEGYKNSDTNMIFWKPPHELFEEIKMGVVEHSVHAFAASSISASTEVVSHTSQFQLVLQDLIDIFSYFKFDVKQRLRFYLQTVHGISEDILRTMFPLDTDADAVEDADFIKINGVESSVIHKLKIISTYPPPETQFEISRLTCERDVREYYNSYRNGFPLEYQDISKDILISLSVVQIYQNHY